MKTPTQITITAWALPTAPRPNAEKKDSPSDPLLSQAAPSSPSDFSISRELNVGRFDSEGVRLIVGRYGKLGVSLRHVHVPSLLSRCLRDVTSDGLAG